MSGRSRPAGRSLLGTCLTYFLLCSLLLFGLNAAVGALIAGRLDRAFPTADRVLAYEDALAADDFAALPRLDRCAFLVFDADDQMLYASDPALAAYIRPADLWLIGNADHQLYYSVAETTDQSGAQYYYIALNLFHKDTGAEEFIDYCIVDRSYRIVEGGLFPGLERLDRRQFALLQGVYRGDWEISKYGYEAADGADRTLVFAAPMLTDESYQRALEHAGRLRLLSVPAMALAVFVLARLLSRGVRRSLRPLHEAIVAYGAGQRIEVGPARVPRELSYVTESFTHLLDQLEQADAARAQAAQEKQRIVADLSHDLKTPLTVIRGYAQALADGVVPPDREKQYLDTICRKAADSAALLDTLFAYARLDHPAYTLEAEPLDLCALVRAYLAEKYLELETAGLRPAPDLPGQAVPCEADPRLLRRLLDNLTGNAIQYAPSGTTLFVVLRAAGDQVCLSIGDNGAGIPPAIRKTLFDPFVTGNAARTTGSGTGLGMAIVQRIVSLHHGTICRADPPREGWKTEFVITLPRRQPDTGEPSHAAAPESTK